MNPLPRGGVRFRTSRYLGPSFMRDGWVRSPHTGKEFPLTGEIKEALAFFATPRTVTQFLERRKDKTAWKRVARRLVKDQMLLEESSNQDALFHLERVRIDPNTSCNGRCIYCPVSLRPRAARVMSMEHFSRILQRLGPYRTSLKSISLSSYNEPTLDPFFLERVAGIRALGLDYEMYSNASGLTPRKTEALLSMGVATAVFNIPTVDPREYSRLKGVHDLPRVLRNTRHWLDSGLHAIIQVQGLGDSAHQRNFAGVQDFFDHPRADVRLRVSHDRAGHLPAPWSWRIRHRSLHGCSYAPLGSMVINLVHINAKGECFICCQDFDEKYVAGNVLDSPLDEILSGPKMQELRRWVYGIEEAPADFICRSCVSAVGPDRALALGK